jgi:hypothetical protein
MVGVRLPAVVIARIDRMAARLNADRSTIIRMMIEQAVKYGSRKVRVWCDLVIARLQQHGGRGRTKADKIAADGMDYVVELSKNYLAARKRIRVRGKRKAIERQQLLGDPSEPRLPPGR